MIFVEMSFSPTITSMVKYYGILSCLMARPLLTLDLRLHQRYLRHLQSAFESGADINRIIPRSGGTWGLNRHRSETWKQIFWYDDVFRDILSNEDHAHQLSHWLLVTQVFKFMVSNGLSRFELESAPFHFGRNEIEWNESYLVRLLLREWNLLPKQLSRSRYPQRDLIHVYLALSLPGYLSYVTQRNSCLRCLLYPGNQATPSAPIYTGVPAVPRWHDISFLFFSFLVVQHLVCLAFFLRLRT